MTATPVSIPTPLSEVTGRIDALLSDRRTMAQWWVELVSSLDTLGARLVSHQHDLVGRHALAEQIRLDAPHLYSQLRRLDAEQEELTGELERVRIRAGASAGDTSATCDVINEIRDFLHRLRRLELRSNTIVVDAYDRDIGGE